MPDSPPPELSGLVNFRDLGGHQTPGGHVRHGRVFRSDSLAHVNPADVEHLVEERGVRTVVDLRGANEIDAYPNHPMREAGATIHHVPLIDPAKREQSGFEWETMSLVDLYTFILTSAGPQFVEVLQIIAEPANHPVVFHCAAGKDRAGLVAATVLGLLEVSDDEIVADYAQTTAALEELRARAHLRAEGTGRPPADRFMTANAEDMYEVLAWLRAESGGFAPYMLSHGFTDGELALLRTSLIEPGAEAEVLIDTNLGGDFTGVQASAAANEAAGYAGLWTGETQHDPFLQLVLAAEATERVTLGTSIAIAFGRTPMTLANTAFDLARYSRGRFVLGLGSQVKPHIERRFSMPWSHPAARMREFVAALRAIWASWQDGEPLDFRGEFYTHTLMTPFFSPPAHEWGPPPVYLAGVGKLMTEVAGEVCDGFFFHGFTTPAYLREVTLPALARGRARSNADSSLDGFTIAGPAFTCVGRTEEEVQAAIQGAKEQIAFYASTPAYRGVLEHHGWGDLQPELTRMSKEGKWKEMAGLIDDDVVRTFAAVGDVPTVARELRERWSAATRLTFYMPYRVDDDVRRELLAELR